MAKSPDEWQRECEDLHRQLSAKQARINKGVRALDHVAFRLTATSSPESIDLREFVLKTQEDLRGK